MNKTKIALVLMTIVLAFIAAKFVACGGSSGGGGGGGGGGGTQTDRLRITNNCGYTIWIQQENMPSGTASVVKIEQGSSYDYEIPDEGLASTRFWPKKGCDGSGQDCEWGQSSNPCPTTTGCAPPVESKLEATWGCTLADQTQCAYTPQGDQITDTYFNTSAVDGYTFPYTVTVSGNTITDEGQPCQNIDCTNMDLSRCPTGENLSQGQTQTHPEYASEDLRVFDPNNTSQVIGCFSPCKKLNYTATWSGLGLNEQSDAVVMYCCPTPPISTEECRAGPVVNTQYVALIHEMCTGGVYGYAYDDIAGLHKCSAGTMIEMTFGPNCP
ncbi:MAG: hypothetical protein ABH871_05920 [Pseudomonadota bacterium]